MPFTPITITDTGLRGDGTNPALTAEYVFTLSDAIADGAGHRIGRWETVVGYGLADGRLSLSTSAYVPVVLAANNDPTTQPVGTTWHLDAKIDGRQQPRLTFVVPYNAPGGMLDLATVAPATVTPSYSYVTTGQLYALLGGVDGGAPDSIYTTASVDGGSP